MNKEAKEKWIDALCSGKYKQGKSCLMGTDNAYCCLGVLVRVFEKVHKLKFDTETTPNGNIVIGDHTYTPPQMVLDWVGINGNDVSLLMHLNDMHHCNFEGIARVIERISQE